MFFKLGQTNLEGAFMFVVPGVLVMGSVVLLAVAPHANLHLLFLVPAITHGHFISIPCLHRLWTWSYKEGQRKKINTDKKLYMVLLLISCIFHKEISHLPLDTKVRV